MVGMVGFLVLFDREYCLAVLEIEIKTDLCLLAQISAVVTVFFSILLNCLLPKYSTIRNIILMNKPKLDLKTTLASVREIVLFSMFCL